MRKSQTAKLPKVSADHVALGLKRGVGHNKALEIADRLSHWLKAVGPEDFNHQINLEDIRKAERFWTQVRNILGK